jgi:CRP/FNR family transcriptional regulator, cyclic AMP receptor protein
VSAALGVGSAGTGAADVCVRDLSPDGKWTTYTAIAAGSWFGEGSLLKDERRRYSVIAMRDSRVAYMPRATFRYLYETSLPFTHSLVNQ